MNHNTEPPENGPWARPSLFADDAANSRDAAAAERGPVKILSTIDTRSKGAGRAARRSPSRGPRTPWRAGLAVVAVGAVLGAAYWAFNAGSFDDAAGPIEVAQRDTRPASPASAVAASAAAVVAASQPAAPAATDAAPTVAAAAEPQAARIENVVVATAASDAVATAAASTASASAQDPFSSLTPTRQTRATSGAAAASKASGTKVASAGTPAQRVSASSEPARVASAAPAANRKAPARDANARLDADIDLLEAMVSHMAGRRAAAVPVRAPAPAVAAAVTAGSAPAGAGREVVLQQEPPLPTSELVRRCMTLGWLESQLCRARICSGQWGVDAACPTAQQDTNLLR
ncbi:hypothetical protein [Caldimonas brevitalea]|uniref:Light-harvesting LHII, alpha subunit B / Histone protein n=1 Tax=Caldimonas brevitalea TaxID=413882 RepID=A0A0G3BGT8_9BURK|nr:hypothetical protein [Caldimonas brevitalea]AKJ28547.1 light-harvesting LHII, alpha subunit B / Histone protein [Caldimonas brevitalea]